MATFLPSRGCIFYVGSGGVGAYAMSGLGGKDLIITGAPATDRDAFQPVLGLGGKKLIYTFGTGFGNIQITGIVLLGPTGQASATPARLFNFYESNRISRSKSAVNVWVPGGGYRMHLTGFGLGTPDAEYHIQPFAFSGVIARPE